MQQTIFADIQGETLLLLVRRGKHCDYLKLRKGGSLGSNWTDILETHLIENPELVIALKKGITIAV